MAGRRTEGLRRGLWQAPCRDGIGGTAAVHPRSLRETGELEAGPEEQEAAVLRMDLRLKQEIHSSRLLFCEMACFCLLASLCICSEQCLSSVDLLEQ